MRTKTLAGLAASTAVFLLVGILSGVVADSGELPTLPRSWSPSGGGNETGNETPPPGDNETGNKTPPGKDPKQDPDGLELSPRNQTAKVLPGQNVTYRFTVSNHESHALAVSFHHDDAPDGWSAQFADIPQEVAGHGNVTFSLIVRAPLLPFGPFVPLQAYIGLSVESDKGHLVEGSTHTRLLL